MLDALEGHLGDFMILWVSDHGDMNGDHYLWRKRYPWEASAHIPMMIKSPAIIRNNNATTAKRPSRPQQSGALVELRDIAPTIYDFLGILESVQQRDPLLNGKSLLPVVNGTSHGVREWLDLEHGSMNNYSHHFNALVGYADEAQAVCKYLWKYIFYAHDGSEQLFCLSKDPNETFDLVMEYPEILKLWRQRMVDQFEQEGRGEAWVKNGKLQIRRESTTFGPHYPCHQRKGASGDHFLRNSIS